MKKSLIAVFSVSLTAGTLCLAYAKAKDFYIGKLQSLWEMEAQKIQRSFTKAQKHYLRGELEKLYPWQVRFFYNYYLKVFNNATLESLKPYIVKILDKKLNEKVDFNYVAEVFEGPTGTIAKPIIVKSLTPSKK